MLSIVRRPQRQRSQITQMIEGLLSDGRLPTKTDVAVLLAHAVAALKGQPKLESTLPAFLVAAIARNQPEQVPLIHAADLLRLVFTVVGHGNESEVSAALDAQTLRRRRKPARCDSPLSRVRAPFVPRRIRDSVSRSVRCPSPVDNAIIFARRISIASRSTELPSCNQFTG